MRARVLVPGALGLGVALALLAGAAGAARKADVFWTSPEMAALDVRSIAMVPAASYEHSLEHERLVEGSLGAALKGAGYRWVSTLVTRDWIARAGGDSLKAAVAAQLLAHQRIDSLDAPMLSRTLRARALLCVCIDRMEQMQLEPHQSGKPTTTVQMHASLVDSTGRLLWTANGSETMEGPYQDPANGSLGVDATGLGNSLVTGRQGAPTYREVLDKMLARWAPQFPARATAPVAN